MSSSLTSFFPTEQAAFLSSLLFFSPVNHLSIHCEPQQRHNNKGSIQIKSVMALSIFQAGHAFLFIQRMKTGRFLSQLSLFIERMNVHVRASFTRFLSILSTPPPLPSPDSCCPCHHWVTVEVVSRRGMMPNLTGVGPYLYSLHSRFCLKGFVYTRPINHLLPSHNPAAFKVALVMDTLCTNGANVHLFLLLLKDEMKISTPLLTFPFSAFFIMSSSLP